jgi:hypothetical protein
MVNNWLASGLKTTAQAKPMKAPAKIPLAVKPNKNKNRIINRFSN